MSEGETSAGVGLVSSHLPPNFSQVPASWSYCRCVMKREIPVWNKSDLHSAGVMICVDWPHSPACKNIPLFTSKQAGGGAPVVGSAAFLSFVSPTPEREGHLHAQPERQGGQEKGGTKARVGILHKPLSNETLGSHRKVGESIALREVPS